MTPPSSSTRASAPSAGPDRRPLDFHRGRNGLDVTEEKA